MQKPFPPLNALRAFEAAARHLSLTKAALELHVTAGALSHQIRGLEELLGLKLFERRVRSLALTAAGKQLYPGLQTGFRQIQEAVAGLRDERSTNSLVISTPPGFTAKWLAPRLHRFSSAHPEIDTRVSSSINVANFITDGVDVAIRNLPLSAPPQPELVAEKLVELSFVPVCSVSLMDRHGPFNAASELKSVPLIHDDSFADHNGAPTWRQWFRQAGFEDADVSRGLRFSNADHALDAAIEGAGVLLAPDALAYDELRVGRLVVAIDLFLPSDRAYYFVCGKAQQDYPKVQAFRSWLWQEIALMDWRKVTGLRPQRKTRRPAVAANLRH